MLKPGFLLPPLMFSRAEIDALVLGSRWVVKRGDAELSAAAAKALAKIKTVLPDKLRAEAEQTALIVGACETSAASMDLGLMREAIRRERKLAIDYEDGAGKASRRTVWPFALAYFDRVHVLAAWCELREDFRHFRVDRIVALDIQPTRYPRRRGALLHDWREGEGIGAQ